MLPGGTSHFHWAKSGEYISQITAIGPLGMEYVDPTDDPETIEHVITTMHATAAEISPDPLP